MGNEYIEIGVRVRRSYSDNFELIVWICELSQLLQYIPPYFKIGNNGIKKIW